MSKRIGYQTVVFDNPPTILSTASTVGPKEGEGPLAYFFDTVLDDILNGQETWEKAESKIVEDTLKLAANKGAIPMDNIDFILTGDLLNQITGSSFGVRALNRPFLGLFGACSTMGEALSVGAMLIDGGSANYILAAASSHFCAAEKQFRYPLELGTQRPPTATWTVTGDGAALLSREGSGPYITHVTPGKIVDLGIKNPMNMGAAMAPAAVDTLIAHLNDTGRTPDFYDVIATGDLGYVGHELVVRLMKDNGIILGKNYTDCGILIFDKETQDTHSGGSGCACAAVTFAGYFYDKIQKGQINNMLLIPTGALMSPTSTQQGETIPSVAHAVAISKNK